MYRWYLNGPHERDPALTRRVAPSVLSVREWMQPRGVQCINEVLGKTDS